jgi:hypothetical protein
MATEPQLGTAALEPLIQQYAATDPKLFEVLSGLIKNIAVINRNLYPLVVAGAAAESEGGVAATPVFVGFEILNQKFLSLVWNAASNAASYELREGDIDGIWDDATSLLETTQLEVRLDPVETGTHYYFLKAINGTGERSTGFATLIVEITAIGSSSLAVQVIDNNVLLRWSEPDSPFEISYYTIFRDTTLVGYIDSTFFVIFETTAGQYVYSVRAVDIAGNEGPENLIAADVKQPPDFELQDARLSILGGTVVNGLVYGPIEIGWDYGDLAGWIQDDTDGWFAAYTGKLLFCIDLTQIFEDHFIDNSWDSPAEQITAGYPLYPQPTLLTGSYQETIDYGEVFNNLILNLTWTLEQLSSAGSVTVSSEIEFSEDGVVWSTPVSGPSAFSESFQYARITFDFVGENDSAAAIFSNLLILLDVKREVDSGLVIALSTDALGTPVTFAKDFKDVDSITLTPTKQAEPLSAIYDFVDVPNPTGFTVFVFDSIGGRVSADVSWKARGII